MEIEPYRRYLPATTSSLSSSALKIGSAMAAGSLFTLLFGFPFVLLAFVSLMGAGYIHFKKR